MRNIFKLSGIIALITIIGFSFACSNGSTDGNTDPKTLVIQNVTQTVINYINGDDFLVLTNKDNLAIAAADLENEDITLPGSYPGTVSIPIYKANTSERWTGTGVYNVILNFNHDADLYRHTSMVAFDSATVTVDFNDFEQP